MFFSLIYYLLAIPFWLTALFILLCLLFAIGLRILEPFKGVCTCTTKLNGKTALITGGNSGIGLETARDFARRGARVIIASRNEKQAAAAITDIVNTTGNQDVHFKPLNLASFANVRQFAKEFNATEKRLDILVNNAGCGGIYNKRTQDGIHVVLQVNHFGPFLLTQLLLDKLKASGASRVIIVSSLAHWNARLRDLTGKRPGIWLPYARSKLMNIMWARALAKRVPRNVTVNSLHPGVVLTNIFHPLPSLPRAFIEWVVSLMFKSAEEGAQTTIHLAVAPELASASGGYYVDCKPACSSAVSKDEKLIDEVWEKSCLITNS